MTTVWACASTWLILMLKIMTNMGKRFARFLNILKMSNAYASSFGRYIKWLNEWYTMSVKNFHFLFKSMFLKNNGRIEKKLKLICRSSLRKTNLPPEFQQLFSPYLLIKKKLDPLQFKMGEALKTKHIIVLHILVHISIVCTKVGVKDTHYGWAHARKVFRDYNN